jgi:predicted membrane channel-forming protein YqfA (hemolysin III family)
MDIKFSNWNKESHTTLVVLGGVIASLTAFMPQFLSVLHEAPFTISTEVDNWIFWIFKMATVVLAGLSIFYKSPEEEK